MTFVRFLGDCLVHLFKGSKLYWAWLSGLLLMIGIGFAAYVQQISGGLAVTGMGDQVAWGIYIANFTFLVGVAAAAVLLVVPAYVFHRDEALTVVMLAEGLAVAACAMCMLFVTVDLGRPERFWHLIPFIGHLNWPRSMLAWDVVALLGYFVLNLTIPMYILFQRYKGKPANPKAYIPAVAISIAWAVLLLAEESFLFSANPGRPFWATAVLTPRFTASAFTAGPACMIIAFSAIHLTTRFKVPGATFRLLALITTIALQANLFKVAGEIFTEFYAPTEHGASARYLFIGLNGDTSLVPWIWTALSIEVVAVAVLMTHRLRQNALFRNGAAILAIVGIWIEKGMGVVIPGFVPTPLGEVMGYDPTTIETLVSFGIWAVAIALELGDLHARGVVPEAVPQR